MISVQDYNDFEKQSVGKRDTVKLLGQVHPSDKHKVVKVRGLPYSVTEDDICFLFKEFKIVPQDVIIESFNGKKSGYALIFFSSEADA